jgi:hypothetical protein
MSAPPSNGGEPQADGMTLPCRAEDMNDNIPPPPAVQTPLLMPKWRLHMIILRRFNTPFPH